MNLSTLFCRECVANAAASEFYIGLALVLSISVFCLYRCYKSFTFKRLIEDMPTSKVRSASQGFTELIGIANVISHPQIAPLSQQPCVWWRYTIERYQRSRKSSSWVTIESGASKQPFYLDDTTGQCIVEPQGAEISCKHVKVWYGNTKRPSTTTTSGISFGRRYRYTEYKIMDGDPLYTLGHFETDAKGHRQLTTQQISGNILRQWKLNYKDLLARFDHDGNGELDIDEWQRVKKAAEKQAEVERQQLLDQPDEHSLSKPQGKGLPFIIGSHSQDKLISQYQWHTIGYCIGFLLAGSMSTWLITARSFSG